MPARAVSRLELVCGDPRVEIEATAGMHVARSGRARHAMAAFTYPVAEPRSQYDYNSAQIGQ